MSVFYHGFTHFTACLFKAFLVKFVLAKLTTFFDCKIIITVEPYDQILRFGSKLFINNIPVCALNRKQKTPGKAIEGILILIERYKR